ncbi:MAG: hypothetical protein KGS72_24405 [Cyanobacteria bacterium REEB67]|nr:hypothetical protein [Cyanobacteria bacterium REEB67]
MTQNALGQPLTSEKMGESRNATHAALNHWFVRNRGVQRHGWNVEYQPTYYFDNLRCPAGISEVYWDTLACAERRWSAPVHKQLDLADQRKLQDRMVRSTTSMPRFSQPVSRPVVDPAVCSEPALLRLLPPVTGTALKAMSAVDY